MSYSTEVLDVLRSALDTTRPGDDCIQCGGGPCTFPLPAPIPPNAAPWWSHKQREENI